MSFMGLQGDIPEKCAKLYEFSKVNVNLLQSYIIKFINFQKIRIENKEIAEGTLHNYIKAIKLFLSMNDIEINWKRIGKGVPAERHSADIRIPTIEEIKKKMQEPEFPREYQGMYLGRMGNIFSSSQISFCTKLAEEFSIEKIPISLYTLKSLGIDPGFSSSPTGIVELEHIKNNGEHIIRVIDCHLIDKGDPNKIVELCWDIYKKYGYMNTAFFIDGSNAAMTNLLKIKFGESLHWQQIKDFGSNSNVKIRPISFNSEHKNMLSNLHAIITKGYLAIPEKYSELITSLRTAYAIELDLDKKQTSYDDLLDALRLSLKGYNIE
jgi:hypothetical protein